MAWTYTDAPDTTTTNGKRDAVRMMIGDTNESDQLMSNAAIDFNISQYGNLYSAASACALVIAGKFARIVTKKVGDLSINASDKVKHYNDLAKRLRSQSARRAAAPFVGGISVADKVTRESDTDRTVPKFTRDMQEYAVTADGE